MMNKITINGIDVSKCKHYTNLNMNCLELPTQPFKCQNDENCYFKQLARAKKEIEKWKHQAELGSDTADRLSKELEDKNQEIEELKAQVDEWKENCNNNFELVAIRTKLLTDIAIKLGLNTAIIERKDVFDKIDKLQSKEQLSLNQSQVIITLRNNLNVNKQKNANLLQENEELKKQLDKYLNQEEEEIRQLNNDNKLDDILESIKKANEQLEKESKYKQALDEIEYYINNQGINNKWNMRIQRFRMGILDIINKAK